MPYGEWEWEVELAKMMLCSYLLRALNDKPGLLPRFGHCMYWVLSVYFLLSTLCLLKYAHWYGRPREHQAPRILLGGRIGNLGHETDNVHS